MIRTLTILKQLHKVKATKNYFHYKCKHRYGSFQTNNKLNEANKVEMERGAPLTEEEKEKSRHFQWLKQAPEQFRKPSEEAEMQFTTILSLQPFMEKEKVQIDLEKCCQL